MHTTTPSAITATWGDETTVARAGLLVYMAHLAMPAFMAVESAYGMRFHSEDRLRISVQRTAGLVVRGLGLDPAHPAGLADLQVAAQFRAVAAMHDSMAMPAWARPFVASLLAIGPFVVHGCAYTDAEPIYHATMRDLAAAAGTQLPAQSKTEEWVNYSIARWARPTADGLAGYILLAKAFSGHLASLVDEPRVPTLLRDLGAAALR